MRKLEDFAVLEPFLTINQSPACPVITVNCRISLLLSSLSTDSLFYSQIDPQSLWRHKFIKRERDSGVGGKGHRRDTTAHVRVNVRTCDLGYRVHLAYFSSYGFKQTAHECLM